jgi:hypothetical protein
MKALRTISAIFFSVLVLVSSTSFMIGVHVCMGEIQNIALFAKADDCEKEQNLPPCHRHETAPCCQDETVIHDADDFEASVTDLQISNPGTIDIIQPPVLIAEIIPSSSVTHIQWCNYDPPLRSPDVIIEQQIFLI